MESFLPASVFVVAGQELILLSSDVGAMRRVLKRPVAGVQRLGPNPNGTYTDMIFNPRIGDRRWIRDPHEAIRGWFLSWGGLLDGIYVDVVVHGEGEAAS